MFCISLVQVIIVDKSMWQHSFVCSLVYILYMIYSFPVSEGGVAGFLKFWRYYHIISRTMSCYDICFLSEKI